MNSSIRRIDELGRIVIPKDIRKKLHIKDNEMIQIYTDNNKICLEKYSELPNIKEYLLTILDRTKRITKNDYIITTTDNVIASTEKSILSNKINNYIEKVLKENKTIENEWYEGEIVGNYFVSSYINIYPVILNTDKMGVLIEMSKSKIINSDILKLLCQIIELNLND